MQRVCASNGDFRPIARSHRPSFNNAHACQPASAGSRISASSNLRERKFHPVHTAGPRTLRRQQRSGFPKDIQHRDPAKPYQDGIPVPSSNAFRNRFRNPAITHCLIVKRPVRLDVNEAAPQRSATSASART